MVASKETGGKGARKYFVPLLRLAVPICATSLLLTGNANAASLVTLQISTQLSGIQGLLAQIGPELSAALFILAGVFYAIGQIMPPDKKAAFHTTSVNIIMGAIVLAALSFAATGLAQVSTHLLVNATANTVNTIVP